MRRVDLLDLSIYSILYNTLTFEVVKITGQYSKGMGLEDNDIIPAEYLDGSVHSGIRVGDCKKWQLIDEDMPDRVKIVILATKLKKLEDFVYTRLK